MTNQLPRRPNATEQEIVDGFLAVCHSRSANAGIRTPTDLATAS